MGKKAKTRAPEKMPDCAAVTVVLDRTTGEVTASYEPDFVRPWEVIYALREIARRLDDPEDDIEEDITETDYPFRFGL